MSSPPAPAPTRAPHRQPRSRGRLRITAAAVAALTFASMAAALDARADIPPAPAGWTTVFADDFTGGAGAAVDSRSWVHVTGTSYPGGPAHFGTGEIETMTNDPRNVSLDGQGHLRITPIRDPGGAWTSGRIETVRGDFQPPRGGKMRVESRLRMPDVTGAEAAGYWPAFWMLGTPYRGNWWNWPGIGEIDIMENVQGLNNVWATLHCGVTPGGPCNETVGIGGQRPCSPTTCQAAFHTYAVEWDRSTAVEELRWYLDGALFHTVRATQVDAATWRNATDHGFFIILNVAIGGEFPAKLGGGPTAATASGRSMIVDYVSVRTAPGATTPSPDASPTPGPDPTPGRRDARSANQAESYDAGAGLRIGESSAGGQHLASISDGDWALYRGVDFGANAADQFYARVASGVCCNLSGLVEVRLDDRSSPPVGTFAIGNTGGWQSWRTVPANMAPVRGVHDVYLTFRSGQGAEYLNVDWFSFGP